MGITTKKGNPNKPVRIMIFGAEGSGKSTFGAKSDKPVFISPEGGVDHLLTKDNEPVDEFPNINTWDAVRKSVQDLIKEPHEFKTLIIDSADWLETLCHAKIIGQSGKSIITCNGGYGAGYRQAQTLHKELIDDLNMLRDKRNMNIIVTAHAHVRAVKDPAILEDYDAFEPKCHEFVSSLWREWVDALLFVRFRTFVKSSDDTIKARAMGDGTRVVYTVKQPAFQAKNRFGLPPEMNFTEKYWDDLSKYVVKAPEETFAQLQVECETLLMQISDETLLANAKNFLNDVKLGDIEKMKTARKRLRQIVGEK